MLLKGRILICYTIVVSSVVAAHNYYYGSGIDRIYPPTHKARWYRSPSFILTQPVNNYDVIYNTRGGSSAEEDDKDEDSSVTTSTDPAVEEEAAANDNDDKIVESADDTTSAQNLTFSATTSHDGSSEDPDGVPARFLLMKKDDRAEAKEAFEATLAWRKEFNVDTILSRPHSQFDVCKVLVPHYFAGEDPHGNIVFVQRPALLDFELMRKNNATIDDLLMHYIYVIEYCWNILEPGPPEGVMTNILDMRGLSFRAMKNQEYIDFGKRFVNMMSENYPGRSYKTLVINAPRWFHALYKIFKPLIRESTRQKIVILKAGEQQDTALKFYLGDCMPNDLISDDSWEKPEPGTKWFLPGEDRDACEPGPNSIMEYDMRQFAIKQLEAHNSTIDEIL